MSNPMVVTFPGEDWLEALRPLPPGIEGRVWAVHEPAVETLGDDAERVGVVIWPYMSRPRAPRSLAELPALRAVQTLTAGYDGLPELMPQGVQLANAAGVHDASTAELAVGLMIASLRGIDEAVRNADQRVWEHHQRASLADRSVLLIGVGSVGGAIADRLAPFEVSLTRVGSRARDDARGHVHATKELPELVPASDIVVLVTPLNVATRHLVDREFLARMPDGSLLVNVGRGAVVDTDALVAELRSHRLRAALDVVDPEPLPPDHPLWSAPGLILTPHVGGNSTAMRPRAVALLRGQLERLAAGEPLINVVATG